MKIFAIVVLCFTFSTSLGLKLPSYIKPCYKNDQKFDECLLQNAQDTLKQEQFLSGDSKYRIHSFDPVLVPEMHLSQGGLNMTYKNLKMYGLRNAKVTLVKFNLKTRKCDFQIVIPEFKILLDYRIKGKFGNFPLNGGGEGILLMKNMKVTVSNQFDLVKKKDAKEHMVFKDVVLKSVPELFSATFKEEIEQNKLLIDAVAIVINENWKESYEELGSNGIDEVVGKIFQQSLNGLGTLVPYEDFFPNKN